jgi:CDP-glycerol glycerophosphotransferase (TagB/SpsB family)
MIYEIFGRRRQTIISYFSTWYGLTSVHFTGKRILRRLSDEYLLLFRPHPDTPPDILVSYERLTQSRDNVLLVPEGRYADLDLPALLAASDLFIVDYGSLVLDCLLTGRPLVFALDRIFLDNYRNSFRKSRRLLYWTIRNSSKALLLFWKDPFSVRRSAYAPVAEVACSSPWIDQWGGPSVNAVLARALSQPPDVGARESVRRRIFYGLEGDATSRLAAFVEDLLRLVS